MDKVIALVNGTSFVDMNESSNLTLSDGSFKELINFTNMTRLSELFLENVRTNGIFMAPINEVLRPKGQKIDSWESFWALITLNLSLLLTVNFKYVVQFIMYITPKIFHYLRDHAPRHSLFSFNLNNNFLFGKSRSPPSQTPPEPDLENVGIRNRRHSLPKPRNPELLLRGMPSGQDPKN